jgi:hypothetical protein
VREQASKQAGFTWFRIGSCGCLLEHRNDPVGSVKDGNLPISCVSQEGPCSMESVDHDKLDIGLFYV